MNKKRKKEKFHISEENKDVMLNVYTTPLFHISVACCYVDLGYQGCCSMWNDSKTCLIMLDKSIDKWGLFRTIPHECLHIVQFAEKAVGTTFDDETSAYLLGHLTNFIFSEFTEI